MQNRRAYRTNKKSCGGLMVSVHISGSIGRVLVLENSEKTQYFSPPRIINGYNNDSFFFFFQPLAMVWLIHSYFDIVITKFIINTRREEMSNEELKVCLKYFSHVCEDEKWHLSSMKSTRAVILDHFPYSQPHNKPFPLSLTLLILRQSQVSNHF